MIDEGRYIRVARGERSNEEILQVDGKVVAIRVRGTIIGTRGFVPATANDIAECHRFTREPPMSAWDYFCQEDR